MIRADDIRDRQTTSVTGTSLQGCCSNAYLSSTVPPRLAITGRTAPVPHSTI